MIVRNKLCLSFLTRVIPPKLQINAETKIHFTSPYFKKTHHLTYPQSFPFSSLKPPSSSSQQPRPYLASTVLTSLIQQSATIQQLKSVFRTHSHQLNFIHRTALLRKVTQRPFDKDDQLVQNVIENINTNWKHDFLLPDSNNSRAIANIICYMSRKAKLHHLDHHFLNIDFNLLANHLDNPREFVMMFTGLLKLQLIDQLHKLYPHFNMQTFLKQKIGRHFHPSDLVSIWFNIIKFQKTSKDLNDFFADRLKNKHFKDNLIDYMQIVYCFVNTEKDRSVEMMYPVMAYPKSVKNEKGYMGAHELSVFYEQLSKLKKNHDIYFSEEFNMLLEKCFERIINERDVPLRNIANVFVQMSNWETPTSRIMEKVYHKYYTVLKHEITLIMESRNKKVKYNVDGLSFVTLFEQLLACYHPESGYLKELVSISLKYVSMITENRLLSNYSERVFVRMLGAIVVAQQIMVKEFPEHRIALDENLQNKLRQEMSFRMFSEKGSMEKVIQFVEVMGIRDKLICERYRKAMKSFENHGQERSSEAQERLTRKCIFQENSVGGCKCSEA